MIWVLIIGMIGALMLSPPVSVGPIRAAKCEQGEMISLLKRHEIQVLLKAGFSVGDVAERSETSVDTVRRVRRETSVEHTDDVAARAERRIGRPSKAAPYGTKVSAWLADEATLPTQELLRRAKEAGYSGIKTAFYALVDGRKQRVHFFASRLKYSRFAQVTLVENERVETLVRCLARDFVAFGGLPLMAVFDRPRTIVKKSGKGRAVEEFNATFAQAIVDIGVGVEMCAPRSGWQKGTVEHFVKWVKSSFFKHRKFQDETDLRAQLAAWHVEINAKTPSRATSDIPETRRQEELPRLRPIKVFPENLALRLPIVVGPTAEVIFEGAPYSMPPKAAHVAGTVLLYEERLRIVDRILERGRLLRLDGPSVRTKHLPGDELADDLSDDSNGSRFSGIGAAEFPERTSETRGFTRGVPEFMPAGLLRLGVGIGGRRKIAERVRVLAVPPRANVV